MNDVEKKASTLMGLSHDKLIEMLRKYNFACGCTKRNTTKIIAVQTLLRYERDGICPPRPAPGLSDGAGARRG